MQGILTALGGLGLFLLGMLVMTEGLRRLAGDALQAWLTRFTNSPASGAMTGTVATAILQSSSATTVTTVGFVAAGLLTFPQALGIVFGANVGTTVTGWMVAVLGFKLKIGAAALPVIFAGAMLNIFGRARWSDAGRVLAGFGMILLGIGFMQEGMAGFEGMVTPDRFPPDTLGGRLLLLGMGAFLVLVTQSSSAGVAIAMTALSIGALNFPQAASLVIGMDVGTTVTAVLAALGSSDAARRTGFSHTIYNLFTALGALLILDPYIWVVENMSSGGIGSSPEIALVGFHTVFNLLALLIGLPLAGRFAQLMEKLVPRRDSGLAWRLDDRLLAEPRAAAAAMSATLRDELRHMLQWLAHALGAHRPPPELAHEEVYQDLRDTRDYLDRMNAVPSGGNQQIEVASAIHALDHLRRMYWRLRQTDQIVVLRGATDLQESRAGLQEVAVNIAARLPDGPDQTSCDSAEQLAWSLRSSAEMDREGAISHAVEQDLGVAETSQWMEARRWLQRMAHHVWRVSAHLGGTAVEEEQPD